MNRKQRREFAKQAAKKGISPDAIQAFLKVNSTQQATIPEGQRVRLNVEKILSDPDYPRKTDKWKQFVQNNKNTVFTVEYDPKYGESPSLVLLAEDPSEVKWLWWVGDLEVIK